MTDRSSVALTRHAVVASACLPLLAVAACSGAVGGGEDEADTSSRDDQGRDDQPMRPKGSLERIPEEPLVCDDPDVLDIGESPFARLTNAQYVRTLRDLAAPLSLDAELGLDLPAETADKKGFLNNYKQQGVQAQHVEQYQLIARAVAKTIVTGLDELGVTDCDAVDGEAAEDACAASFVDTFGLRAYRRPLADEERDGLRALFETARGQWGFADALTIVTSAMLSAPQLLYRIEVGDGDGAGNGVRLSGYEIGARLSYLFWGTTPDDELLEAAREGKLDSTAGIEAQAARLLGDPRARQGLGEFAAQWLRFAKLSADSSAIKKDKARFPDYSDEAARASFAGLEAFVADALLAEEGGLHKLLTSDIAFVNAASAPLYGLEAAGDALVPMELDPSRRRGVLTQAALLAGFAHATVQAPVQRGVFILEHLLCSPPPAPPPNVPGAPPAEATDEETTRQKFVRAHEGQPACKTCHQRLDAVGFAFENYDAVGRWQDEEIVGDARKALPVDATSALSDTFDADGDFANGLELIDALSGSEQVAQCFVNNFFHYALGRDTVRADGCSLAAIADRVIEDEGSFKSLLVATIKSPQFRHRAIIEP